MLKGPVLNGSTTPTASPRPRPPPAPPSSPVKPPGALPALRQPEDRGEGQPPQETRNRSPLSTAAPASAASPPARAQSARKLIPSASSSMPSPHTTVVIHSKR